MFTKYCLTSLIWPKRDDNCLEQEPLWLIGGGEGGRGGGGFWERSLQNKNSRFGTENTFTVVFDIGDFRALTHIFYPQTNQELPFSNSSIIHKENSKEINV